MGGRGFIALTAASIAIMAAIEAAVSSWTHTYVPELWPYAVTLGALGAALVARALPEPSRGRFLLRHSLLALIAPVSAVHAAGDAASAPATFATWYGLYAFTFALHAVWALWRSAPRIDDGHIVRVLAGVLLVTELVLVPYTTLAIAPEADEPHYLILAQSLAFDRDVDLTNNYRPESYQTFYPGVLRDVHAIEVGPKLYPIRDLGLPIVAALPFALAGRPGVLVLLAVVAAVVVAQIYRLLRELDISPQIAVAATALAGLSHPFHAYSTQIYPEIFLTLLGILTIRLLRRGTSMSIRDAALASTLIALLPWFTTRAWFFGAGLAACLAAFTLLPALTSPHDRRAALYRAAAAVAPGLAIVAALLAFNWSLFELAIPGAGFYLVSDQQQVLNDAPWLGAAGLLFGRVFGLVGRAPIYLVAFVGIAPLLLRMRRHGPAVAALVVSWTAHFLFIASLEHWHSDWSPPSRNLVATIPLLVVAVAIGFETIAHSRRRSILFLPVAAAAGWSLLISLVLGAQPFLRYELPDALRATRATGRLWVLIQDTLGGVDLGRILPSTTRVTDSTGPLVLMWCAIALVLAMWGWRAARHSE